MEGSQANARTQCVAIDTNALRFLANSKFYGSSNLLRVFDIFHIDLRSRERTGSRVLAGNRRLSKAQFNCATQGSGVEYTRGR